MHARPDTDRPGLDRRRLLQALTIAGSCGAQAGGQQSGLALAVLRDAATIHGTNLTDARLQVIRPALVHRLGQLHGFRALDLDDQVGPAPTKLH